MNLSLEQLIVMMCGPVIASTKCDFDEAFNVLSRLSDRYGVEWGADINEIRYYDWVRAAIDSIDMEQQMQYTDDKT